MQKATFGAGCFWCVEAVFKQLTGVHHVEPGYTGGTTKDPTYKEVCSGTTGHAEVCRVEFDPEVIRFADLLEVFWKTHDPTTLNRQGNDVGTQYRSVIFFHDEDQRKIASDLKAELDQSGAWDDPIVTTIEPLGDYYTAETYHHDYFANNPDQQYCSVVIRPKVEKFKKVFGDRLKRD